MIFRTGCILKSWSSELLNISEFYKLGEPGHCKYVKSFAKSFCIKIIQIKCDIPNSTVIFWWCKLPWNRWNRDSKLGSLLVSSMIPPIWASVIWVSCNQNQLVLIKPTLLEETKDLITDKLPLNYISKTNHSSLYSIYLRYSQLLLFELNYIQ